MRKQYLTRALALGLAAGLTICGCTGSSSDREQETKEEILLLDPVGDQASVETVQKRDLYQAAMYPAFVVPKTTSYAFEEAVGFEGFDRMPGEQVAAGDVLASADTTAIDGQIEDMEERIAEKDEAYVEYMTEMSKPPETARTALEQLRWEMEQRHYQQLYEVDQTLQLQKLELYQSQREALFLRSDTAGEVVSVVLSADSAGRIQTPRNLAAKQKLIAVGDRTQPVLCCDYIRKAVIASAKELYAVINGERYEVVYQPMDTDTYTKLTEQGADVYSTFTLKNGKNKVSAGDYGMITVITEKREQVLAVPKSAIQKDSDGFFVYRMDEGRRVFTRVEKGITDGVYTEILSGLSEGDVIYAESTVTLEGEKTYTLEYGNYAATYEEVGMLGYPNCTDVLNEIQNGTVYFTEYLVEQYDFVQAGDPIAKIRVESDPVEEQRRTTRLTRVTQRYQDLESALDLTKEENQKLLAAQLKIYEDARDRYLEFQTDKETIYLTAPTDGIVTYLEKLDAEKQLYAGQRVAEIADKERCYIIVSNENKQLQYGNSVDISYQDKDGKSQKAQGMVANISGRGIDQELQSDYAIIAISPEDSIRMAAPPPHTSSWQAAFRFRVSAKVRSMEHVLLVPKAAVIDVGGTTYVSVMGEDGSRKLTPFLSGGHDDAHYWVVEGLSEGMKICLR